MLFSHPFKRPLQGRPLVTTPQLSSSSSLVLGAQTPQTIAQIMGVLDNGALSLFADVSGAHSQTANGTGMFFALSHNDNRVAGGKVGVWQAAAGTGQSRGHQ